MPQPNASAGARTAQLLVVLLAFAWGLSWIGTAVALKEVPVWSLRFVGTGLGTVVLFAAAALSGHDLRIPRGEVRHVAVAGFLNVAVFNVSAAFAQMSGATSRVVIIVYSMPIWVAVLSHFMLGERLNNVRRLALALCIGGLTILVWPQFELGMPPSIFLALTCALSWALASVYMKWVKAKVAPLANAAWQLLIGTVFIAVGMLAVDHYPRVWPIHIESVLAIFYIGFFGVGLAHFLWWSIVGRLTTLTASIGVLLAPAVGVTASAIMLHERPTIPDIVGFVLIFAAAACVLLQPNVPHDEMPE